MPIKLNIATVSGLIDEKLSHKPAMRKDFHTFVSYHEAIGNLSTTESDTEKTKLRVQAILTQSASAGGRLLETQGVEALQVAAINALERFCVIHFVSVQLAFLRGLEGVIDALSIVAEKRAPKQKTKGGPRLIKEGVQQILELASAIDVPYTLAVNPTSQLGDYFKEQVRVFSMLLDATPISLDGRESLQKCIEIAMHDYGAWAGSKTEAAALVSSYLNYQQQIAQRNVVADDVHGLSAALENWLAAGANLGERRHTAWQNYRQTLAELPDDKATMFDESFGVRKVFVQPIATYKVAGVKREADAPVADVAGLLGTLISDRTEGEDLILLCGGPGSGKSTLCRILASELAINEYVHPVFLRLRRLQDSHDIVGFLESYLQDLGLIDRISDLADVSNLVLILDGFDELVMASRTKLREFFHALKEGLSTGPLRHAKAIVSGRDTLFPKGAGLPTGAHVISLLPFDRPRIAAWGAKWRDQHDRAQAKSFFPENLISDDKRRGHNGSPLEHLVSWPLTLHLVARAHTSGSIDLKPETAAQVEKALLYRSIVADTAFRQVDQAGGRGRLNEQQMRKFVQAIAWEMYSTGREALDVSEGLPILRSVFPEAGEAELMDLADVTIVNQPELTKGDETGFEFVHKSFSEYFAAEQIASGVEEVCFKVAQYGAEEETWRMSVSEATSTLSALFAIRLLTPEVQEMLEPMLGDFKAFLDKDRLTITKLEIKSLGMNLERKLERVEGLISDFAGGGLLDPVTDAARTSKLVNSDLEGFGNFASALLFLAVALVRRMALLEKDSKRVVHITPGNFVRLIHMVLAGDVLIDGAYAQRALTSIDTMIDNRASEIFFPPIAPSLLEGVRGLNLPLDSAIADATSELTLSALDNILLRLMLDVLGPLREFGIRNHHMHYDYEMRRGGGSIDYFQRIASYRAHQHRRRDGNRDDIERRLFETFDFLRRTDRFAASPEQLDEALYRVRHMMQDRRLPHTHYPELFERVEMMLRDLAFEGRRMVPPRRAKESRNR